MSNVHNRSVYINDRLKEFRETFLKISQNGLAKILECTQQKVNRLEVGKQELNYKDVTTLAELGMNIHWLYTGEGNMLSSKQGVRKQAQELIKTLETFID